MTHDDTSRRAPGKRAPAKERLAGGRFVIERRLGTGGMGSVYAAYDRERQQHVALKTLHQRRDGEAFYAFKREFRTLADVAHPNLVSLYELFADDRQCFFTMELVDGVDFLTHVRPEATELDRNRLDEALRQLADGVRALHAAGKLHRDLKPSNVLVTFEGRVVLLDFGMALDYQQRFEPESFETGFAGTLAYMAPEQANGETSTPATDWYAFGSMVFEALTGRVPFEGSLVQILNRKLRGDAPDPIELGAQEGPLTDLCRRLLRRPPSERPAAQEVWSLLQSLISRDGDPGKVSAGEEAGHDTASHDRAEPDPAGAPPNPGVSGSHDPVTQELVPWTPTLVGRDAELAALEEAWERTQQGQVSIVYVHGTSGMGKTALIDTFLQRLRDRLTRTGEKPKILTGRCYEHERVPYKALDGVVDSLSRALGRWGDAAEPWLPRDLRALVRLFPVLRRVDLVERRAARGRESPDRLTLRRWAFGALRELLARIAREQPLVLTIDDLQWADADSTLLLQDLLREPDPPSLMLIASFRSEEIEAQPFLARLLADTDGEGRRELELGPLDDDAATRLTTTLLGDDAPGLDRLRETLVRESAGSPFFIEQLASYARATDSTLSSFVNLAEMLDHRLAMLPPGGADLMRVLAVAGRPLETAVAFRAAGLEGDERPLGAALRSANLARSSGSAQRLEIYHDRIRESIADRLDREEVRRRHRHLADTLEQRGSDDPEALFEHRLGAGQPELAATQALRAARKAAAALAFDHAATFFRHSLELGDPPRAARFTLQRRLAESLGNAGRPQDAAEAFLAAAELGNPRQALECRSAAAREFLGGGYLDEGLRGIRQVLDEIGHPIVEGRLGAVLSLLWQRLRLRFRGLDFTPRSVDEVAPRDLLQVDAFWAAASSLVTVRPVQAADFQTRHLRAALDAGERNRITRALAIETSFVARTGEPARARAEQIRELALGVASQVDDPFAGAIATLHAGISAYLVGSWSRAVELCDAADRTFEDQCQGVLWDQNAARRYALASLIYRGDFDTLRRRVRLQLAQARQRGNVLASTELCTRVSIAWLAADDPEGSMAEIEAVMTPWEGFHLPHYNAFWGRNQADLYRDDPASAWARLEATWPLLQRSLLLRIQILEIEALWLRGRTAVAVAPLRATRERLALATRCADAIEKAGVAYGAPLSGMLRAGIARLQGDTDSARRALEQVVVDSAASDMDLHAAIARHALASLGAISHEASSPESGEAWMLGHGIENPERMARMIAPGCF